MLSPDLYKIITAITDAIYRGSTEVNLLPTALMRWAAFYGQVHLFNHIVSTIDRKTLLGVAHGHEISKPTQQQSKEMKLQNLLSNSQNKRIQHHRFINPGFVHQMLHSSDHDGMNDRQLFDFFPGSTYNVLIPEDIPNVRAIFWHQGWLAKPMTQPISLYGIFKEHKLWILQQPSFHISTIKKVIMLSVCVVEPCTGATALSNRRVRLLIIESKSEDGIIYHSCRSHSKTHKWKKSGAELSNLKGHQSHAWRSRNGF